MSRTKRAFGVILAVLAVLLLLPLVYAFAAYPAEYNLRVMRWLDSDVYDYQKFPSRSFQASEIPFQFDQSPDEEKVRALFERNPAVSDLDAFLVETGTQAFIVIEDENVLYENYFNGAARDSIVTSFSVAK